jgi:hypothetical protein
MMDTYLILAQPEITVNKDYGNSDITKKMIGEYVSEQLKRITGDITIDNIISIYVEPKIVQ